MRRTIPLVLLLTLASTAGAEGPTLAVQEAGIGPNLQQDLLWLADPQNPGYVAFDVLHGDLRALRSSQGNFSTSLLACLADDAAGSPLPALPQPPPGSHYFFIVRAQETLDVCGAGSWNESFSVAPLRQPADRDAEIAASASTCPCP